MTRAFGDPESYNETDGNQAAPGVAATVLPVGPAAALGVCRDVAPGIHLHGAVSVKVPLDD